MKKKVAKKASARNALDRKVQRLMREYRLFGVPQGGAATMLSNTGLTAPLYNLTATSQF